MTAVARWLSPADVSSFDDACVPVRIATAEQVHAARLDVRARWMLGFVDGRTLLGTICSTAGLPVAEAREGVGDLVLHGIVELRATTRGPAWTQPTR
jgi:hypothetical protein